jgi:molecular chaperone HscB
LGLNSLVNLADDDFTLLALPQHYAVSPAELQARWKAALTTAHPDRFSQAGAAGQRLAMQWSVRLNEAYQRLKHPLKRAEYLCALRGVKVDAERNTAMPAAFLIQQMEWREALDNAKTDVAKDAIKAELKAQAAQFEAQITQAFDMDSAPEKAAQLVRAWMFVDKLLQQLK